MNSSWQTIRENASTYSLCGAVSTMPFSIGICHGFLTVFIVLWLANNDWRKKYERAKSNPQLIILLALGLVLFMGVAYSEDKQTAWFTMEKKIFFFLVPAAILTSAIDSSKVLKKLTRFFCASCFIALVVCYIQALLQLSLFENGQIGSEAVNYLATSDFWKADTPKPWLFLSYVSLSGGIGMHPTYLAMYCAFCCIVLLNEHRQNTNTLFKAAIIILLLFFSVSVIFLAARVVIAMLAAIYACTLFYEVVVTRFTWKKVIILPALILVLIAGVMSNPVTRYRQVDEILAAGISVSPGSHYSNSTGIRASLWWLSMKALTNPMVGVGAGDVQHAVKAMSERYHVTNVLESYDPHSQFLFFLLSSGLVGLSLFLLYLALGFVKALQNRDLVFLNFLLLFTVVCATESVLELQKGIAFFSVFFSCMAFLKTEAKSLSPVIDFANAN